MIYLDNNATTPLDPRVWDAMLPYFRDEFGNASSRHAMGCRAAAAVEHARAAVAERVGGDPREIYWTSGATESNNLAILGVASSPYYARRDRHVVTIRTEHPAVLDPCRELERRGFRVTFLGVDAEGRLDLDALEGALTDRTLLVSAMHANNETGVIHPMEAIGRIARSHGALFHTDATQSFGKEEIDVERASIDLLSFSAHKVHGPKGVGGLYVRRRGPRVRVDPLLFGGGHERGLRSGTLNVPGIVGLGAAAAACGDEIQTSIPRVRALRDRLELALLALDGVVLNGAIAPRLAGTSNLSFGAVDARAILQRMPDLAVSTASACTSAALQPSHVLGAMRCDEARIGSSLRFSLGRFTTADEVHRAIEMVTAAVRAERGHVAMPAARDPLDAQ